MVVKTSDLGGAVICNGSSSSSSRRGRRRRRSRSSSSSSRCEQVKRMNLVVLRGVEYRHIWSGVWCSQPLPHPPQMVGSGQLGCAGGGQGSQDAPPPPVGGVWGPSSHCGVVVGF